MQMIIAEMGTVVDAQYRLRINDFRIFYDIDENRVEILAIILKSKATEWLKKTGESI